MGHDHKPAIKSFRLDGRFMVIYPPDLGVSDNRDFSTWPFLQWICTHKFTFMVVSFPHKGFTVRCLKSLLSGNATLREKRRYRGRIGFQTAGVTFSLHELWSLQSLKVAWHKGLCFSFLCVWLTYSLSRTVLDLMLMNITPPVIYWESPLIHDQIIINSQNWECHISCMTSQCGANQAALWTVMKQIFPLFEKKRAL